ncbi:MAG: trimethylamine corrinoid protein 1 [Promethearchaeota archaeon CR_4]|nr:MAG: trimethylamine corrinoid protein 1 [Candidatus Lokiarchaeota archaeon CR_4]
MIKLDKNKILIDIKKAVLTGEDALAQNLARKAIKEGAEPIKVLNEAQNAMIEAGELWKRNDYFQGDVVLSAEAFHVVMEVVEPLLSSGEIGKSGKVIIGTVAGDMHNLGKIMVIATLRGAGFEVVDLGEDVSIQTFISKIKQLKPNILGLGCYMTTTMMEMKEIIKELQKEGLRNNLKIMIGGVPITQEYANEIGADAWGKDAFDAADKAKGLVGVK